MTKQLGLALALVVGAVYVFGSSVEAAEGTIDRFLRRINAAAAAVEPHDPRRAQASCRALVRDLFDIDAMATLTSAGTWARMTRPQQRDYRSALVDRAARDCTRRRSEIARKTLRLLGVRKGGDGTQLITVRAEGGRTLVWRVRPSSGELQAVDLLIDGRSLVRDVRRDAEATLQRSGGQVQALILDLRR